MASFPKLLLVAALCVLCGCATITRGTKEVLVVESDPVGAEVTTSIGLVGKTPATFKVSRKGGFTVTIVKEGYEPVTVQVGSQVAGGGAAGMAGNVILGGLIGAAVDAGSGAMKELKPNPIVVKLVPLGKAEETLDSDKQVDQDRQDNEQSDEETPVVKEEMKSVSFRIDMSPISSDKVLLSIAELGKA